jgi:hypothetical protein
MLSARLGGSEMGGLQGDAVAGGVIRAQTATGMSQRIPFGPPSLVAPAFNADRCPR